MSVMRSILVLIMQCVVVQVCRRSGGGVVGGGVVGGGVVGAGGAAPGDYGVSGVVGPAPAPAPHHLALTINQQRLRAAPYDNLVTITLLTVPTFTIPLLTVRLLATPLPTVPILTVMIDR